MNDALKIGILSANHRSPAFVDLMKRTQASLREKLEIPANYTILFTSSATECWEIIAQSLTKNGSLHFYNGAFGQKWLDYTIRLKGTSLGLPFDLNSVPDTKAAPPLEAESVVCVTHNETSNGTRLPEVTMRSLRRKFPKQLIAVDATSSMGGTQLDFKTADIWFASIQKCFGLPAGLGIMICSPKVRKVAEQTGDRLRYNNLLFMYEMMDKFQTPYTPNVLGIYLLSRTIEAAEPISIISERLDERHNNWISFTEKLNSIWPLISNEAVRSQTVLPLAGEPELISKLKTAAAKAGLLLGEGYGEWKENTFRIANFPAILPAEIKRLQSFLKKF